MLMFVIRLTISAICDCALMFMEVEQRRPGTLRERRDRD